MNLVSYDFQESNIFIDLPRFDSITYDGYLEGKVRRYRAGREEEHCRVLVLNIIRQEENIIWDAFQDLIKRSVENAAQLVRGVYLFDLLTKDMHREIKTFNHGEITEMLVNHARKCAVGEKRLVRYSSIYGILHKINAVDWGKMKLQTAVEVFKDQDSYLDLMLKKLLKNFEFSHEPGLLMVHDLSQNPIFNSDDDIQQKRLKQLMIKQIPTSIEFPPEVYIRDQNGLRELYSGMEVS